MHDEIKAIMADVLDIDVSSISESTTMEDIESWDSLAHVKLVTALESGLDVMLDVSEIETMTSFRAIVDVLSRHR
jgi:acyl carrier protein